jgi:diacylglycerol kinase
MTKKLSFGPVNKAIERILDLSADAHIRRREIAKDSLAYKTLAEAIAAYGKVLTLLTALQQREEFYSIVSQYEWSKGVAASG